MIRVTDNLAEFERGLSNALQEQLPFAAARALNDTAADVASAERDAIERVVDRPTPFTLRGPGVLGRASKRNLLAVAGIRRVQAQYLKWQVEGGTRTPDGRAVLVPFQARRNRYGNMSRNYVRTLLSSGRAFVASRDDPRTSHLAPGIYQRRRLRGRAAPPVLLVAFEDRVEYEPKFDFYGVALSRARSNMPGHLSTRLREAWATRRR